MVGGVNNNPGVQQPQQNVFQRMGASIKAGFEAIGNKLAEFGHAVSNFFKSLGSAANNAPANTNPNGSTAPMLKGETFTTVEKQQHMMDAKVSNLFNALAGSNHSYINQESFENVARAVMETPMSVAGMKAYGVTLEEAVAISMYTSQAFGVINEALRNNTGDVRMVALADAFRSGLAKLPSFDGNPIDTPDGEMYQVFRGAKLPREAGEQHLVGMEVSDPGIMSTTYDKSEAFKGVNYSMTLLLKPGSQGKDISMFSDKPTECEVAFPPGVDFIVTSRVLDSGGLLSPEMEATYHPGFQGSQPMGTVELVMQEI